MTHQPPVDVDGTPVHVIGAPITVSGERWVTLAPEHAYEDDDELLWEWSLTSGRLIRTN